MQPRHLCLAADSETWFWIILATIYAYALLSVLHFSAADRLADDADFQGRLRHGVHSIAISIRRVHVLVLLGIKQG